MHKEIKIKQQLTTLHLFSFNISRATPANKINGSDKYDGEDDEEFRLNNVSNHGCHLCQNGILIWFGIEMALIITSKSDG